MQGQAHTQAVWVVLPKGGKLRYAPRGSEIEEQDHLRACGPPENSRKGTWSGKSPLIEQIAASAADPESAMGKALALAAAIRSLRTQSVVAERRKGIDSSCLLCGIGSTPHHRLWNSCACDFQHLAEDTWLDTWSLMRGPSAVDGSPVQARILRCDLWELRQALLYLAPPVRALTDTDTVHRRRGREWCTAEERPDADIWCDIWTKLDDVGGGSEVFSLGQAKDHCSLNAMTGLGGRDLAGVRANSVADEAAIMEAALYAKVRGRQMGERGRELAVANSHFLVGCRTVDLVLGLRTTLEISTGQLALRICGQLGERVAGLERRGACRHVENALVSIQRGGRIKSEA